VKSTGLYPHPHIDTSPIPAITQAGGVLLTDTIDQTGLGRYLSNALASWRKPFAIHDPGKILLDLALSLALGGDCLSDAGIVRSEPGIYGSVASTPTVSRLIGWLAEDAGAAVTAIRRARQKARTHAWSVAGTRAPDHGASADDPLIIDLDASIVIAHSEKEQAAGTFKRTFGHHPLLAFADHGPAGTGELLAAALRKGNAGSNTVTDHIAITRAALAQLPGRRARPGKKVLIRTDTAGGTHGFLDWLTGRRLSYSVGFSLPIDFPDIYHQIPETEWQDAYTSDGGIRDGAGVVELTGLLDLTGWPAGMRVIARRERPHPGAQLRFDDVDGYRITAFATNSRRGQLADLEVRHRRRGRCEDRIRNAKDTGLRNLPLHGFDQNQIWLEIVGLASEIVAWAGMLGLADTQARRWEPKTLRYRVYTIAATIARSARRTIVHYSSQHPWAPLIVAAIGRVRALPRAPG
jgi:hypothetical protein